MKEDIFMLTLNLMWGVSDLVAHLPHLIVLLFFALLFDDIGVYVSFPNGSHLASMADHGIFVRSKTEGLDLGTLYMWRIIHLGDLRDPQRLPSGVRYIEYRTLPPLPLHLFLPVTWSE